MIQIICLSNSFHISGHAGQAEHGRDIVCASVSAISQSALLGLKKYGLVQERIKSGDMFVLFITSSVESNAIYDTMKNGLQQIAKQYPQYVTYKEEIE